MLKRVFGQNNEKNNFTVRKINISCTNMPSLRCKHRSKSKHEHGLCQIAVFAFIEYDTQSKCKYGR